MSDLQHVPELPIEAPMTLVRGRKREATQRLLGDTITISDAAWQEPSRLPGWTRAHVATHLARNADAFRRAVDGMHHHTSTRMYPTEAEKEHDIEEGSLRGALELQIDLDTSAGQLATVFDTIEDFEADHEVVLGPGRRMPVHLLPLARLNEVVLHHIDLDCGFEAVDVESDIARWLLEWNCRLISLRDDYPALQIWSNTGYQARLGAAGMEPVLVTGSDQQLFGWLTGRASSEGIPGAADLEIPGY